MTVTTTAATPPGTYPLTIRGASGPRTRTVNVTLVVNGDFSISATPASRTIAPGGTATYTVTVTAGTGFAGTVSFSIGGAPPRATVTFNPTSVVNAGTSTLTVATFTNAETNAHVDDHGSGGGRVHSTTVT